MDAIRSIFSPNGRRGRKENAFFRTNKIHLLFGHLRCQIFVRPTTGFSANIRRKKTILLVHFKILPSGIRILRVFIYCLFFSSPFSYSDETIFIDVELFSKSSQRKSIRPYTMTIATVDFLHSILGAYSYQPKIRWALSAFLCPYLLTSFPFEILFT